VEKVGAQRIKSKEIEMYGGKRKGASESENNKYIEKLEKAIVTCILGQREYKFLVHSFSLIFETNQCDLPAFSLCQQPLKETSGCPRHFLKFFFHRLCDFS
jgi:hypothetical protein